MDDNSIKVLSWIGISMVITYRSFFLDLTIGISQIFYPRRKPCYDISELIRKNIKILTVSITEDTDFLITWIKRVEQTSIIWKTGETKPLPESIKFQMVSVNGNSEVAYQIMVLPKHSPDKEACIKQIKGNEENMTDCDEEENNTLTEWLSQYKETIIQSIRKDAMTFIEILKGDSKFLDENIRKDIDSLTRTPRLSCKGMCRYYTIILTKTTSNKGTSTEYILHDNETPTACVLQDKKTDNKPLTYCILHNTIIERIHSNNESPPKCILEDKETMTEGSPQDKETMTEGSLQDKEIMTQGSIQDKETMTASTTHIRALFEPGCPSALNITTTKIELKWEEPSIGTDFIHFYQIICEEQSSSWTCLFETPKHACNYVVKGLKPNAEYAFKIKAVKKGGNKGTISQTLIISTLEISCDRMAEDLLEPGCPSALDITSTKVELKWEELSKGTDFIHFYQIFCEEQSSSRRWLFETPRNDCNFVVEGLKPNTKYAFKIQAVKNGQNKGPVSKALTVTTLEISCDRMAEFLYVLFYIAVLIWFTYLFCYSLTAT